MVESGGRIEVGEVLARSWSLFVWNVVELLSVVAVIYSPYIVWVMVRGGAGHRYEESVPFLLSVVLSPIATAALTWTVLRRWAGHRVSVGDAVRHGLSQLGTYVGVGVVAGLAIAAGLLLLIVPGIVVACMLAVAAPVAVVEGTDVRESLQRSVELTRGHRVDIFWTLLVIGLVGAAVGFALGLVLGAFDIDDTRVGRLFTHVLLQLVFQALVSVAAVVVYATLRRIHEGKDPLELAAGVE